MHRMIGNKEQCFGNRVYLFFDAAPYRLAHPRASGFAGEDGTEIGKFGLQPLDKCALSRSVNTFDCNQHSDLTRPQ